MILCVSSFPFLLSCIPFHSNSLFDRTRSCVKGMAGEECWPGKSRVPTDRALSRETREVSPCAPVQFH